MGYARTSDKILDYFHTHQNIQVTLNELADATGLDANQVKSAINTLKSSRYKMNFETVMTGNVWIYRPDKGKSVDVNTVNTVMFEQVGKSSTGVIVIQDEDGKLYKAVEIT